MPKQQKLSILQQALFEEKKLKFSKRLKKGGQPYSEQLKNILPNANLMYKQKKWFDAEQNEKYILGGFQSGKTEPFAMNGIWLSYVNRPYTILLVSPTFSNAKKIMLKKLTKILKENDIVYETNGATPGIMEVNIHWGGDENDIGNIWCVGGDSTAAWIGATVAACGMDEFLRQSEDTDRDMISRASEPNATLPMLFYSGTPEPDTMSWGFDIIESGEEDSEDRFIITVSTRDNIYLKKSYVKSLEKKLDAEQQRNYIEGKATSRKGGRLYYTYDDGRLVIPSENFTLNKDQMLQILLIYDFNTTPGCCSEFLIRAPALIQIDEYMLSKSNTYELTDLVIHRMKERYGAEPGKRPLQNVSLVISGDATADKENTVTPIQGFNDFTIIANKFSKAGILFHMDVPKSNPLVYNRVVFANNIFEKEYFKILSHCKNTREDLRYMKQKQGVVGFKKDKSNMKRSHFSDIVDYALWLARRMGVFPQEVVESSGETMLCGDERIFK